MKMQWDRVDAWFIGVSAIIPENDRKVKLVKFIQVKSSRQKDGTTGIKIIINKEEKCSFQVKSGQIKSIRVKARSQLCGRGSVVISYITKHTCRYVRLSS